MYENVKLNEKEGECKSSEFVNSCWSDADSKQFAMELSEDIKPGIYRASFYQYIGDKSIEFYIDFEVLDE